MRSTKEEFLEILSNYQGILHKVNLIYFKNAADREDNLQEMIYQLWKSYPGLKNKASIGSWIYAVAINTSISRLKKSFKVEYRNSIPDIVSADTIIEDISHKESSQMLLKAIYNLNEIDKSIMLLYMEELSYDEISEIIGISQSNVGVRISRAKKILKENLKDLSHGK